MFKTQNHSTAESVGSPPQTNIQRKMSKGSANRNLTIDATTLPSVKHRRGVSNTPQNNLLTASAGKNIVGMRANFHDIRGSDEATYNGPLNLASNQRYLATFRNSRQLETTKNSFSFSLPSNFELAAHMHGFDPRHDGTVKDFQARNIGNLKSFKTTKIANSKEQIEIIHSQLRQEHGMEEELLNVHALEQHLHPSMREDFLNISGHNPLLGYLSTLNASFVPVLDYLICFKSELGLCLQRLVESYNLIFLSQFQGYNKNENATKREFQTKIEYVDARIKEVEQ